MERRWGRAGGRAGPSAEEISRQEQRGRLGQCRKAGTMQESWDNAGKPERSSSKTQGQKSEKLPQGKILEREWD